MGGVLFNRLGRRITLTPLGTEVLQRAQRLVSDADALKQTGKTLHAGLSGQLRLGLSSGPGALLSVPLMLHMAQHHPRLHLAISRGNTGVLLHELREQKLDAAIVDVARRSNAVVLTVLAVAADLVPLNMVPPLNATARFGLVTLSRRHEAPALRIVREQLPGWVRAMAGALL